ncbi:hypothetical protein HELRODRAFT_169147 [Helobdella robusta]|uniref:Uncharacterized protein n=1 Tax=Helobdella robusta TaxID=6412 RepID=T1F1G9_HELRO|nr:hypothetical protein HELRODRAFT_169147 [Helobdella robusta]ESO08336.1 hypothetical protein HELRODRAFT_169147 [Helobdella robusta]
MCHHLKQKNCLVTLFFGQILMTTYYWSMRHCSISFDPTLQLFSQYRDLTPTFPVRNDPRQREYIHAAKSIHTDTYTDETTNREILNKRKTHLTAIHHDWYAKYYRRGTFSYIRRCSIKQGEKLQKTHTELHDRRDGKKNIRHTRVYSRDETEQDGKDTTQLTNINKIKTVKVLHFAFAHIKRKEGRNGKFNNFWKDYREKRLRSTTNYCLRLGFVEVDGRQCPERIRYEKK